MPAEFKSKPVPRCLEVIGELTKMLDHEQAASVRRITDFLVLEDPGLVVRDKNRIQPGGEGGVDVGFRAVADHPGMRLR